MKTKCKKIADFSKWQKKANKKGYLLHYLKRNK